MKKLNFSELEKAFNQMTMRERVIMFGALIICTAALTYYWMFEPAMIRQGKADKALQAGYQQEKELSHEIAEIKARLLKDPLQEVNNKIAFSKQVLVALDKQLDEKLVRFIHSQKMPAALAKLLSSSPGVKVKLLKSLPLQSFTSAVDGAEGVSAENIFYKHTLEIQLVGNYNAVYRYLLNLETLQEKFYWSSLDYQVVKYPLAEVTIQIYTLSSQQDLVSG
ncbi:hypothetical protein [Psychromonas ossibalaenae]|uniref:hypothetical protein n=1 Tax=Psychromonas ossibalaenae TaxID=444922 RepID=UPI0003732E5D|nr:hypothetical protein [Psychromonas ossibalaenae]